MKDFCHCLFPSALLSSVLVSCTVRHSLHVGKGLPRGSIYQFSNTGLKYLFLCISNNVRADFHCSVCDTCPSLNQSLPLWSSRPRPGTQAWSQSHQTGEWEGNFKGKLVCCYLSEAGGDSWQAIKYPLHWHRLPSFKFFSSSKWKGEGGLPMYPQYMILLGNVRDHRLPDYNQGFGAYSRVLGCLVVIPSIGVENRLGLENINVFLEVFSTPGWIPGLGFSSER